MIDEYAGIFMSDEFLPILFFLFCLDDPDVMENILDNGILLLSILGLNDRLSKDRHF